MPAPDLNLLVALDILLSEGSVVGAAKRMQLSPSAMSRTLARLRDTLGDPLLVRAGRGLVPTPRAIEIRDHVRQLVNDATAALKSADRLDLTQLTQTFTLRTSEGFTETFGPELIDRVNSEAPRVRLRFVQKPNKDSAPLRDGLIDLETGVIEEVTAPELRTQALFRDRYVGVVRLGHAFTHGKMTPERFASGDHILVTRESVDKGPIDDALALVGVNRKIGTVVGGFATALALARVSDLIASVPERHTAGLRTGMYCFPLPVAMPEFTVSMLWHPRQDSDQAHQWLRQCVRDICRWPKDKA